jgi:hypothetical protein
MAPRMVPSAWSPWYGLDRRPSLGSPEQIGLTGGYPVVALAELRRKVAAWDDDFLARLTARCSAEAMRNQSQTSASADRIPTVLQSPRRVG